VIALFLFLSSCSGIVLKGGTCETASETVDTADTVDTSHTETVETGHTDTVDTVDTAIPPVALPLAPWVGAEFVQGYVRETWSPNPDYWWPTFSLSLSRMESGEYVIEGSVVTVVVADAAFVDSYGGDGTSCGITYTATQSNAVAARCADPYALDLVPETSTCEIPSTESRDLQAWFEGMAWTLTWDMAVDAPALDWAAYWWGNELTDPTWFGSGSLTTPEMGIADPNLAETALTFIDGWEQVDMTNDYCDVHDSVFVIGSSIWAMPL